MDIDIKKFKILPICVGTFEENACVDGLIDQCEYMNVCSAFQLLLKNKNKKIFDYLLCEKDFNGEPYFTPIDLEKFIRSNLAIQRIYRMKNGRIIVKPKIYKENIREKKYNKKYKSENKIALSKYGDRWLDHVSKNIGFNIVDGKNFVNTREFFVIDKIDYSSYISLHYKFSKKKIIPIVLLHYKPNRTKKDKIGYVNVEFPFLSKDYCFVGKRSLKKLSPVDKKRGKFLSVCKNLDEEGVMISADVCIKAIEIGLIYLPYVEF